jgi:hypothetical protein
VVEAELHFFQVEIEVSAAHAVVALELGLCVAPEVLDAVDVLPLARREALLMIYPEVFEPVEHQPVVRAEAVGVDDALGDDLRADDLAQRLTRHVLDDAGVDLTVALQQAENGHFAGRAAPARAFAPPAEVALVGFDLAARGAVQFALTREAATDDVVDPLGAAASGVGLLVRLHRTHVTYTS